MYLAPATYLLLNGRRLLDDGPKVNYVAPRWTLMNTVAPIHGPRTVGVILTGMGSERRMRLIKRNGGKTVVQNEETCVVYGMPKAVVDSGQRTA